MKKLTKKINYKLEILYNKWSPFIISIILFVYHTLMFLFTYDIEWILYICLPSIFTSLHMYNSRQTFLFCKVHRCFVNYVICNIIACIFLHYWIVPFMNVYWYSFIFFGTIFTIVLGLYYYIKEHEKIDSRNA